MGEFLTPEQVEAFIANTEDRAVALVGKREWRIPIAAALREYVAIVKAVAEFSDPIWGGERKSVFDDYGCCSLCGAQRTYSDWDGSEQCEHTPDCLWQRARHLMGM